MSDIRRLEAEVVDLIPRAQAGDAGARDALLRRCHGTVYRWALALTADGDEAEDVAQEVLVRVYRYLPGFSGRARFTTWLYRLTRNAALGLRRRVVSRLGLARRLGEQIANEPPVTGAAAAPLEGAETRVVILELVRDLPARQREVFARVDLEGVTPAELAAELKMNPVTVRAHLLRARRALRARILERHPEIAEDRQG